MDSLISVRLVYTMGIRRTKHIMSVCVLMFARVKFSVRAQENSMNKHAKFEKKKNRLRAK